MVFEHDRLADAVYVHVAPPETPVERTQELDQNRVIDYDAEGNVVGIEFITVSQGVDLTAVPHRRELERLFEDHHIRQLA